MAKVTLFWLKLPIMPKIAFIGFDGCYGYSLTGPQDTFHVSNAHWHKQHTDAKPPLEWCTVSPNGAPFSTTSGLNVLPDGDLSLAEDCDIVALSSLFYPGEKEFTQELKKLNPLIEWLTIKYNQGATITSHCTGTFLLAETGLLDNREATTSWWLADQFEKRYPTVDLKVEQLITEQDRLICGGAANSHQLISLRMVENCMGTNIASLSAKTLLVDTNEIEQTPYLTLQNQQQHNDQLVSSAQSWIQRNLKEKISLEELSQHLSVSQRTLIRRFKYAIKDTPNSYIQNLRIDTAKKLLESSGHSVDKIMEQVGYADISSFSRLFRRKTGLTPKAYRQRFQLIAE